MTTLMQDSERVWAGRTRTFTLTIGWGYVAYVLALAVVSTVAALVV